MTTDVRPRPAAAAGWAGTAGLWSGCLLFFLLLFVPVAYSPLKAVLMLVVLLMVAVEGALEGRLRLHPSVVAWTLGLATLSAAFMLRGALHDAPGALRVGTVYILWPVVYTIFAAGAARPRVVRALVRTLVVAAIAVPLYVMSYVLWSIGWLPDLLYLPLDQGQALGVYAGFIELNMYSLSSLLFLVPFVSACLLTWPAGGALPVRRRWLWLALLAGTGVVLISGRRALLLCVAVGPPLTLLLRAALPAATRRETRRVLVVAAAGAVVAAAAVLLYLQHLGFTPQALLAMFMEGFDFSGDVSASLRRQQLYALLDGWAANPLLGAGHGAAAPGLVRSPEMPWAYELSYVALLFHVGVIGFGAYTAGVLWIVWTGLRLLRSVPAVSHYILPTLVGMLCFLVGNATNPYLEKFDYLWVIFLPVTLVNYGLLRRDGARGNARE